MSQVSKIVLFLIYADDTTLSTILRAFKPSTPHENIETGINMELSKIIDWLIVNKLSLNIPKTKYTVFHSKQKRINPPKFKMLLLIEYMTYITKMITIPIISKT